MLPWEIIGWMIIGVVALVVAILGATVAIGFYLGLRGRQRALNTEPAAGQNWDQDGKVLCIYYVRDGRVHVRTANASWSESIDEWKGRVRNRHLTLKGAA